MAQPARSTTVHKSLSEQYSQHQRLLCPVGNHTLPPQRSSRLWPITQATNELKKCTANVIRKPSFSTANGGTSRVGGTAATTKQRMLIFFFLCAVPEHHLALLSRVGRHAVHHPRLHPQQAPVSAQPIADPTPSHCPTPHHFCRFWDLCQICPVGCPKLVWFQVGTNLIGTELHG